MYFQTNLSLVCQLLSEILVMQSAPSLLNVWCISSLFNWPSFKISSTSITQSFGLADLILPSPSSNNHLSCQILMGLPSPTLLRDPISITFLAPIIILFQNQKIVLGKPQI
ncbi:hypothetical protein ACH5RR_023615 [Cinchona calisaya]|uniref:Uncharacterized protein n=1 Tax=Cinchona calisaya TaxID=153742 RepID=A0ABD2ZCB2_9GENT